jgi:hypothetical protein
MRLSARLLALLALALPLATEAQSAASIPRLCFLTFDPGPVESSRFTPFIQGIRDLGWVDGQTIAACGVIGGDQGSNGDESCQLEKALPAVRIAASGTLLVDRCVPELHGRSRRQSLSRESRSSTRTRCSNAAKTGWDGSSKRGLGWVQWGRL